MEIYTTSAGALVITFNYTGDRINFGLAVEKARQEQLKVGFQNCVLCFQPEPW